MQELKALLLRFSKRLVSKLNKTLGRMPVFSLFARRRRQRVILTALIASVILTSALFLFNSILGQVVFTKVIGSYGKMKTFGVEIYWYENCTNPVSSIDWGLITPGRSSNVTFYIMNTGNYATTLSLDAENWNPENASDYLTLKWDYADQIINPRETIRVTLSLIASPNVEDIADFSFDLIISGKA